MNLSAPWIKRPVMTVLIMFAILLSGLIAFYFLPVSNLPNVDYPSISVSVSFPGASPETMANTVATPLEREFMTIPGIEYVTSSNITSSTNIVLQFEVNKSMDSAAQDVEAAISRAKSHLPPTLPADPVYKKVNPSDTPIIYIALTSETVPLAELYTYANTYIGQRLSMLNGVAQVLVYGSPFAVRVQVNPDILANLGITLEDVSNTIINGNPYLPTGQLIGAVQSSSIVAQGQLETANKYDPLIVAYRNQAPVRIKDLGRAIDSLQNNKFEMRYIDKDRTLPTVVLAVQRQPGSNTIQVADGIHQALPKLMAQLPSSIQMRIVFDRSESIRESIKEVEYTLIIALGFVIFVIFFFLGKWTDTIIPSLILPMSILGTFIFMYFLNYSIDNLSLLALILAVGFIVDDAIVVLENIVRRVEEGENPWYAALEGSKQIGFTILSMTLSLVAVFIPLLFMGGLVGKIFQEFAVTLMIITLLSGFISLTLTPMLCSRFIKPRNHEKDKGLFERLANYFNQTLLSIYRPALAWVLDHRWVTLVIGLASLIISGYYFYALPKDFIPDDDIGFIIGFTQSEQGTSPYRMMDYQRQVVDIVNSNPNVNTIVSLAAFPQARNGIVFVRLKPRNERAPIAEVMHELSNKLMYIPGVNTYLKNVPLIDLSIGTQAKGSYQYTLQSVDSTLLYPIAERFIERMKNLPGFQGISSDLEIKNPQLNVEILRDQASRLGVSAGKIETALGLAYAGGRVSRIQTAIDQYDVILEVEPRFQQQAKTLSQIYVSSDEGHHLIPLNAVAHWKEEVGPTSINHISQFPSVTVSFNLAPGMPLGTALEELKKLSQEVLPVQVTGQVQGAAQTFQESIESANILLLIAVLAIYIVLGVLYESFIHPLTILSTLPPATFGALITLAYLGLPLSLYAYLGIILLIGIVKKNGIIMIDYALENQRTLHQTPREAIFNACLVRFRPIMMTTLTAIMGAIPIAIAAGTGAEARRPLGLVIIGGLLFSQLITLFVTPAIYLYLDKFNTKYTPTVPQEILKDNNKNAENSI